MDNLENDVLFGGTYTFTHLRGGEVFAIEKEVKNIIPNEGLNYFNNVIFGGSSASSYYIGLYENNYTPVSTDVMSTFLTSVSEFLSYSETSRGLYVPVVSDVNTSNVASKVTININATGTIRGMFISTSAVKGGTGGSLVSAKLLPTARPVISGDVITIQYDFVASSS